MKKPKTKKRRPMMDDKVAELTKPYRPSREELEKQVDRLHRELSQRTPIEQAANLVSALQQLVDEHRDRQRRLELDLQQTRSDLATALLQHREAMDKFKDLTAIRTEVP